MSVPRKFDHDEARRRRAAGETYVSIARDLGVTPTAVARVCDWRLRAKMDALVAMRQRVNGNPYNYRGTCVDCGGRCRTGSQRCGPCHAEHVRKAPPFDERGWLYCNTCETYRPQSEFPLAAREVGRGGRHTQCRACGTKARQAYRERHKVPCDTCGKPCLPPNEKGARRADRARCRDCYHASRAGGAQ